MAHTRFLYASPGPVVMDTLIVSVHHSAPFIPPKLRDFLITIMQYLDSIADKARSDRKTIVLAEGEDARIITAARRAQDDGIANCILVGSEALINNQASELAIDIGDIKVEDPTSSQYHERYSQQLLEIRRHKGMTLQQAQQQARDPLSYADLMLRMGAADGSIAGAVYTTGDRVRSALQIVGMAAGCNSVSSFMLMLFEAQHHQPKQIMLFADCALIVEPDAQQLAEIAVATVRSAAAFIDTPARVAMLSFSTDGSASHPLVDKVQQATQLARAQLPDVAIEGEVQLDAAIVPDVARQKIAESKIDGRANILVFPGLEAGNIGYKLAQRFGGASAIGPILQGLKHPANDLSRGCTSEDVYNLIAITALQASSVSR